MVDASPVGLRAVSILLQELSGGLLLMLQEVDVERRYSQTEREALALGWACLVILGVPLLYVLFIYLFIIIFL